MADYSIMIIDDNDEDRYLLRRHLELTGLDVTIFEKADGLEAINFLKNHAENLRLHPEDYPPLLLFLDINMPLLDGWGFLDEFAKLREVYDLDTSVVVMFTTSDRHEERENARKYKFVSDYVVKGNYTADQLKAIALGLA